MKLHFCNKSIFMGLLFTTPLLHLIMLTCLFSHVQPLCHPDESTALLEFKDSFVIDRYASADPSAYPKVASWSHEERDDCCSWDGVECDERNSRVIALNLSSSCLYGSINSNSSLFRLSHLQALNLADNDFKHSLIPSRLSDLPRLTYLNLANSIFVGQIPLEISQLSNLSFLDLSRNQLELKWPNFSTLVRNFNDIKYLSLSYVDISSPVPSFLANFSTLSSLYLQNCGLYGEFPNDIFHLPDLQFLNLQLNENLNGSFPEFRSGNPLIKLFVGYTGFSGHIPSSIGNLTSLKVLDVDASRFLGPLPSSLGRLINLQSLQLNENAFSGTVDFDMFLNMKNLTFLGLSDNMLTVHINESSTSLVYKSATVPMFEVLFLGSCNLTSFPDFLRHQSGLKVLDLSRNFIHGKVPKWIWNTSIVGLEINNNFFTGFDVDVLPSQSLRILDFSRNNIAGALPIPPPSTNLFDGSYNELSGEISLLFCNLSLLVLLDLSHNKLSGVLPECLRHVNHNLSSAGALQTSPFGSQLQVMDLSNNQLRGRLPQSLLANCAALKVLKLENNNFSDVFPSWLGNLPELKLLQLRSNRFHGEITSNSLSSYDFPSLQIMDLSHNNISGPLPSHYFQKLNAMKDFDGRKSSYLSTMINFTFLVPIWKVELIYPFSISITNKGRDMEYGKILQVFTVIDLSSNRFEEDIPKCMGNLRGLQVLNLSNNILNGHIPSSLANITQLESLDLSRNELSGEIPQQLVQLTFLEFFDVSFNRLRGLVPQGSQFSTFDISSYEGNAGLWGLPSFNTPPRASPSSSRSDNEENQDSTSWFKSNWVTILPGFVGGLIFGVAIEQLLAIDEQIWFMKVFYFQVGTITKRRRGRN